MQNQNYEVRISIFDLLKIFISKLWLIMLAALVAGGAMYAYSSYTYEPVYKSVSKIYVLRQNADENQSSSGFVQDLNAALTTVNDCKLIVKENTTVSRVIESIGLDCSPDELINNLTLSSTDDSRIISITVKSSSPELAKKIADTVADKGVERIYEVMGIQQASIMAYAKEPSSPSNSAFSTKTIIVAAIAAMAAYAVHILLFISNDKLSDPEEVNTYLSLTVLGVIPNEDDFSQKKKYKKYNGYYKSKKYQYYQRTESPEQTNKDDKAGKNGAEVK